MPSKNMLPKGARRKSVKAEYREQRTLIQERAAELRAAGETPELDDLTEMIDTADFTPHISPHAGRGLSVEGPMGGKHPQIESMQSERRYPARRALEDAEAAPEIHVLDDLEPEDGVRRFIAEPAAAGLRLDAYLARALPDISRARVQLLIEKEQVRVDGIAVKAKHKLHGGERVEIEGDPQPAPLRATPEDIPLTVVYEDDDLAVVDKPAGMMVHAGAGDEETNRGTLVNALLFHMGKRLSGVGGELRPGIVHRLDKDTSGLLVVAKNDATHRKLGDMFSERRLRKVYLALVQGEVPGDEGTITLPIARDALRRTRMTTRRPGAADARSAVTHWRVLERIGSRANPGPYGPFTLLEVHIETGRTHQIRVHMQSMGHPVLGDTLYGAPHAVRSLRGGDPLTLDRNWLHAAELEFLHPRTKARLALRAELPGELREVLDVLRAGD